VVDLAASRAVDDAVAWWEALIGAGGEGMVVKPHEFVARGKKGILQPAIKCRGPEYLRIIYGPDYAMPEHLERLRARPRRQAEPRDPRIRAWASRPSGASSSARRSAACMNASSPCSHWRASRWIRGCRGSLRNRRRFGPRIAIDAGKIKTERISLPNRRGMRRHSRYRWRRFPAARPHVFVIRGRPPYRH
jgi:hypothetical protein